MQVVMRQYQVEPAAVEAIAQRMRETITHQFSHILPGFVEYCLIDGGDGRLVALGIFADAGVAAAAGQLAAGYVRAHFAAVVADIPHATEGTVIVCVLGQGHHAEDAS